MNRKNIYLSDEEIKLLKELEKNESPSSASYEILEVFEAETPNLGKIKIEKIKTRLGGIKYDIHSARKYL